MTAQGRTGLLPRLAQAQRDMLQRINEDTAQELDRAHVCAVCQHAGKHHTIYGCEGPQCACRVPQRLIRCVIRPLDDADRLRLTRKGWDVATMYEAGVTMADEA